MLHEAAPPDAAAMAEELAAAEAPHLIGVRHHSPVLAAAMPALLDAARPDAVCVELPLEADPWLPWLAHPDTTAPVALVVGEEHGYGFYPFADFSPELAALRWARDRGVPARAIDLPAAVAPPHERPALEASEAGPARALRRAAGVDDEEELWDRMVEARSYGADPEQVRRAALAMGWLGRIDEETRGGAAPRELLREAWMRRRIAEVAAELGAQRPAAVVGAFHAPALLPSHRPHGETAEALPPTCDIAIPEPGTAAPGGVTTALIPYTFALLDSRSGYPAGIRDPHWQQDVYLAGGAPELVERAAAHRLAAIARRMRGDGHAAGTPDAAAALQMARDLAALRGLAAPGRRELVEGLTSTMAQGEPLGRARAVAKAAERELVGEHRGAPAPAAPASGLVVHVRRLAADLGLPSPKAPAQQDLRLEPFRGGRDRDRHIALHQMAAAGVAYTEELDLAGVGDAEALGRRWRAAWRPTTEATLELAACYGTTLAAAARGRLAAHLREAGDDLDPARAGELLTRAAECGLADLAEELGQRLDAEVLPRIGLADAVSLHDQVQRLAAGRAPGMPEAPASLARLRTRLAEAAVASLPGIAGSDDPADAAALAGAVRLVQSQAAAPEAVGPARLDWHLRRLAAEGGPLAQGAASAALVLHDTIPAAALADRLAGWLDLAPGGALARRLAGALIVAAPVIEADPGIRAAMDGRIKGWPDPEFLRRLPALREGFEALSTAARARFAEAVAERHGALSAGDLAVDAELLAANAAADLAGRAAATALIPGLDAFDTVAGPAAEGAAPAAPAEPRAAANTIGPLDRWRLILGAPPSQEAPAAAGRASAALDELYGRGHGEGSHIEGSSPRGGSERAQPSVREWAEELEALFGSRVREEVLGRAAARGRGDALDQLDPDRITPSVDLLEHVLSLAGALPESRLARLRPLVDRITRGLVERLARRMRPALAGLAVPRPTRRPTGRLDLGRTIRANLRTARRAPDGALSVIPERPVFAARARRSADWHISIVVDVSGSMERSTIYAALVAAVLHGLPALSVSFTAFSTDVVDLTDRVDDPLGLLLEVSVGGGTDIGAGLTHARARVTVPARTIVALISDFEEGGSLTRTLAEVRALAGSGVHLLGLAALDDTGQPVYNRALAERFAAAGMAVAALSPEELAAWIAEKVRG